MLDPLRDELFSAARGGGAFLNGAPLRVSETADLADAVVSTSLPTALHPGRNEALRNIGNVFPKVSNARLLHCAALCLAYVAAGRTDAHWEHGLNVWDMAAGALLITEAGGKVTALNGETFTPMSRDILCGNAPLHALLQRELV